MKDAMKKTLLLPIVLAIAGTVSAAPASQAELTKMTKRFAPVELKADAVQLLADAAGKDLIKQRHEIAKLAMMFADADGFRPATLLPCVAKRMGNISYAWGAALVLARTASAFSTSPTS